MKVRSYKEYKSNGFSLKYYTRIIDDYGVQHEIVVAYCDGRRMKDFAGEEKYALRSIIYRLVDEQRAADTEAYIKEQAARMGVSEYIVRAHIEEVQRKNMKATIPAEKPEVTAEDIALYDYALGGAPVEGYTITRSETILKSMKKAGITPAAVERARKKINKEKKAAAPAPVAKPAPVVEAPAPAEDFTPHIEENGDLHWENYTVKGPDGNAVVFGSYIPAGLLEPAPADELVQPSKELIEDMKQIAVDDEAAETLATIKANAADGVSGIVLDGVARLVRPEVLQAEVEKIETKLKEDTTPASEKTDTPPTSEKTTAADDYLLTGAYPIWYERNLQIEHVYNRGKYMGTATENIGTIASWGRKQIKVAWVTGKKNVYTIRDFFELVESGKFIVSMPYDAEYMASLKQPTPTEQKTAPTDAEVMETAALIRANYEAMQADIEAEREQAAAAFAEAITAYCEELSRPEPLAWEPETIIIPFEPRPAAEVEQPRRRFAPRLRPVLHRLGRVAAVVLPLLLVVLFVGASTASAPAADAETMAQVIDLPAVTVTAEAPDRFIENEATRLMEDKAPAPSPVKKLAAPSPVKNVADAAECSSQKADTADTPAGEKTASPMNTDSDPHGLTICEGTPWAYTMMNWA